MKVLHVISSGGMYGAEAVILQLSAQIHASQQGESALGVFSHAGKPAPELHAAALRMGLRSELLPCGGQVDLAVPAAIRELAQRHQADVVHAHGYKADIYCYAAFRGRRAPARVSTCHTWYDNDWAVRLYGAADRWVLRKFDQVVAVSAEVKERLLQAGVAEERIRLIRNGVTLPAQKSAAAGVGDPHARLRVGLVGRLAPEKGIDIFLRAAALLKDHHPEVDFVVAGDGPDRPFLEELRQELGLDGTVTFLGQQKNMGAFYSSLDLQVSASRQEGLPMALLEGMAMGLPVVATTVGEVPDVVAEGKTGLLAPPNEPEALARAIAWLLADQERRRQFGEAGRERIRDFFSASRMTEDYVSVYQSALAGRGAQGSRAAMLIGVL